MKINFNGHSSTERETEISQEELALVFEVMKELLLSHIVYGKFDYRYGSYIQQIVTKLCEDHSVDVYYEKDRVNFFNAILEKMVNPYESN